MFQACFFCEIGNSQILTSCVHKFFSFQSRHLGQVAMGASSGTSSLPCLPASPITQPSATSHIALSSRLPSHSGTQQGGQLCLSPQGGSSSRLPAQSSQLSAFGSANTPTVPIRFSISRQNSQPQNTPGFSTASPRVIVFFNIFHVSVYNSVSFLASMTNIYF